MHVPSVSDELLAQYDVTGPRYTSYPTVPEWSKTFDESDAIAALKRASTRPNEPLSVYMHVPFCEHLCAYCGCNVIVAREKAKADPYLHQMGLEMGLVAKHLGERRTLSQIHWGGGTPTFLDIPRIERLWNTLREHFVIADDAEISVEINPVTTSLKQLKALRELGFNRLSIGVQDLNPRVQEAIGRHQTYDQTVAALQTARALGFESINFDLIYGLPFQTTRTWAETLDQVIALEPDRLAVYSFAWLPNLHPHQRRIDGESLPRGRAKLDLFRQAWQAFASAGYASIGMDHFAHPDDKLAVARANGTLWRNFQGYTVQQASETVAFGVSAISDIGGAFIQTARTLPKYRDALMEGRLPVVRGMHRSAEDERRRHLITTLMCNLKLELSDDDQQHFSDALSALGPLVADGLLERDAHSLRVTELGRIFLRNIAMPFDAYLDPHADGQRYSRTV